VRNEEENEEKDKNNPDENQKAPNRDDNIQLENILVAYAEEPFKTFRRVPKSVGVLELKDEDIYVSNVSVFSLKDIKVQNKKANKKRVLSHTFMEPFPDHHDVY